MLKTYATSKGLYQPRPSCSKHRKLNEVISGRFVKIKILTKSIMAVFFAEKIIRNFCTAKIPYIFFGKKNGSVFVQVECI